MPLDHLALVVEGAGARGLHSTVTTEKTGYHLQGAAETAD